MLKGESDFFAAFLVTKVEPTFCAEADGGDGGVGAEFFFVILMPAHSLLSFLIEVGEAGVEGCVG